MQTQGRGCRKVHCEESKQGRIASLERKIKRLDKCVDELFYLIAPFSIWLDVTQTIERERDEQLYRAEAERFYGADGDEPDGRKDIYRSGLTTGDAPDNREERD